MYIESESTLSLSSHLCDYMRSWKVRWSGMNKGTKSECLISCVERTDRSFVAPASPRSPQNQIYSLFTSVTFLIH